MPNLLRIRLSLKGRPIRTYLFDKSQISIGRSPVADVEPSRRLLSGEHTGLVLHCGSIARVLARRTASRGGVLPVLPLPIRGRSRLRSSLPRRLPLQSVPVDFVVLRIRSPRVAGGYPLRVRIPGTGDLAKTPRRCHGRARNYKLFARPLGRDTRGVAFLVIALASTTGLVTLQKADVWQGNRSIGGVRRC